MKYLRRIKSILTRCFIALECYCYDLLRTLSIGGWSRSKRDPYWAISSELIFYYHKIEKGLCMPPPKQLFGVDPARRTIALIEEWRTLNLDRSATPYTCAIEALKSYKQYLHQLGEQDVSDRLFSKFDLAAEAGNEEYQTPIHSMDGGDNTLDIMRRIAMGRRSVRNFDKLKKVDFAAIERAIEVAQLSPNACNRQPWHFHFYDGEDDIERMLALQNGNRGFGHTIPLLAVLTSDEKTFFDATERHEGHLDAGLFLMSFLYALESQGIKSCCLNWCVRPLTDRKCHEIGNIPSHHTIITFLAIGYASSDAMVPRSGRRELTDIIIKH